MSEPVEERAVREYVEATAALLGLAIDPAWLPQVVGQLSGMLAAARLLTEFTLSDDVEAAPVFEP